MLRGRALPAAAPVSAAGAAAADDAATWLEPLRSDGPARDRAIAELHALLLRATRFAVRRAGAGRPHLREALEDLAQQSADDALVAVLAKLDGFRGESRFTTWAYKFAILEASVALRRHEWQGREIPLEHDGWRTLGDRAASPGERAHARELLAAVSAAIATELTGHQRRVLVAVTLDDVPIDVLAERLGTTRGALYKTLHDARRRLRARLVTDGYDLDLADREEHR
ncbi:MAG: sigma-70 family RNA polymerase sigma factor [Actinobacteria bacterium]|nr:sigma-70 family RNA polymerase sigma factor [Actinomycetota bacterium]